MIFLLSCRVGENRDQLTQINNRILTSQAKIEKLRSASTKAARVFSSPKYPAPKAVTDYHTIYEDINPMLQKVRGGGARSWGTWDGGQGAASGRWS